MFLYVAIEYVIQTQVQVFYKEAFRESSGLICLQWCMVSAYLFAQSFNFHQVVD